MKFCFRSSGRKDSTRRFARPVRLRRKFLILFAYICSVMVTKAEISLVRSLFDKKTRTETGLFMVEGPKLVSEAIRSGLSVRRIFASETFPYAHEAVSRKDMERMSALKTPQGILAIVEMPVYGMPAEPGRELTLALDGIQDPGNMGTILRTADWFGIRDIFCSPDTADSYNPKVVQASMGAVLRVRIHYGPLPDILSGAACPIYGAFLDGENIYTADLGVRPAGIIVMGNEGNGIRPDTAALVTRRLCIPPFPIGHPSSESLNVATATAVICSEFRRR